MAFEDQSANLSVGNDLALDQYGGAVDSQFAKSSFMRQFAKVVSVRGTSTVQNNRVGRTSLQALTAGIRPPATKTPLGKVSVTVDTVILARDETSMLDEFQRNFDLRKEIGTDHGKELGKFFDQAHIIAAIKGCQQAAPLDTAGGTLTGFGAGKVDILGNASDELDPDLLYASIEAVITAMEEEEIDVEELVVLVRPTQYTVLANNDKLVNQDFNTEANGSFGMKRVVHCAGARIIKTSRIPTAAITGHKLSNTANSDFYDINAQEAKVVAVVMHPKSLLSGETIPMTSDVWFNKEEKLWFIDSWMAFGVAVDRADTCGAVFKNGTTGITDNVTLVVG